MAETRRSFLGQAAVAVPIAALPAATLALPVTDPHPAWLAEFEQRYADHPAAVADLSDEEAEPIYLAIDRLAGLIARTPARTFAGLRVQIAMLQPEVSERIADDNQEAMLRNLLVAVDRLSGSTAHG